MGPRRLRLEFAPAAWSAVGALTAEEFRAVERALWSVADAQGQGDLASREGQLVIGRLAAWWSIDARAEVLTLQRIQTSEARAS